MQREVWLDCDNANELWAFEILFYIFPAAKSRELQRVSLCKNDGLMMMARWDEADSSR